MFIPNTNNLYSISTSGEVTSVRRNKVLKPLIHSNNYLSVSLQVNGKISIKRIHRLVAEAFIPNPNNLPFVDHIDENKHNNNVENLRWCTTKENLRWFAENNPSIINSDRSSKPVTVDGINFSSVYKAAQYIVEHNPTKLVDTIAKEIRGYLSGKRPAWTMYGKHTIGS